ncbi:alpha/beta hydrolase [Amaricoccus sp.]|uniref:alpha/beta hydrolase n=1 Tax=Amaricoccus sp. TaxID=1872485 RepID=UPI001B40AF50|nr:alpha/beta hydrolase [Amaricoccus sp.]MBP7002017.1 alpha/beta hydrolase [Amaricoccus sp.]
MTSSHVGEFRTSLSRRAALAAAAATVAGAAVAESLPAAADPTAPAGGRIVPARPLPTPTDVSPELQAVIARPLAPGWDAIPADAAGWRAMAAASAEAAAPDIARLKSSYGLAVAADTIAGVPVFRIRPPAVAPAWAGRLLLHLHGGGYVLFPGEAGAGEAMLMAGLAGAEVVSVDYRMAPDHPFPAALDDAAAVWRALAGERDPRTMAVFGSSAGGGLTLALMLRMKAEGGPLPAAIAAGTPWADLTGAGDSLAANAFVDNVLVAATGWVGAAAPLYAGGRSLADPLISPLFGDLVGLPPAIVTSGTRDLLLSDAVRVHRRLRAAGVDAALQVLEGQSHAQFLEPFVPETAEAFAEIAAFLDARLAG